MKPQWRKTGWTAPTVLLVSVAVLVTGCASLGDRSPEAERLTAERFESVRHDPEALQAFLAGMPLGGDLHHHLGGAPTPGTMIVLGADRDLCLPIDPAETWTAQAPPCDEDERPIADALEDAEFRGEIERRWSMLDYAANDPAIDRTEANAHFFSLFGKTAATRRDFARVLAAVRTAAAGQGTLYLETSTGWPGRGVLDRWSDLVWNDDLAIMRQQLLSDPEWHAVRDSIVAGLAAETRRSEDLLGCSGAAPAPGCGVEVRFQRAGIRTREPVQLFLQVVMGFEVARASPLVVGVNLVAPETDAVALRDYALHMRMFGEISAFYPGVPVTLHAGEMTDAQAVALGARDHLPLAIGDPSTGGAGARRVGHAVALDAATGRDALLAQMKHDRIAVEVNLRSNALLLGVTGAAHPLPDYLAAGVPVVLSTDDPGMMGTGLREQFVLAAGYEEISYLYLKRFARNSIEFSFLSDDDRKRLAERLERELAAFEAAQMRSATATRCPVAQVAGVSPTRAATPSLPGPRRARRSAPWLR